MTIAPRENDVLGFTVHGFYKIHYVEWGDPLSDRVVMCVHGMSRNGRDFDYLAKELVQQGYRVVCPDIPGRGKSDWHEDPENYNYPKHISELMTLIARLNIEKLDWIGTSMGGIIGMILSSYPGTPIQKLVINDIGPFIAIGPLQRIKQYLSLTPIFKEEKKARFYLKQLLSPFGPLTTEQLDHMVAHSFFAHPDGSLQLAYDPKILTNIKNEDVDLWHFWDKINLPILLLRGEKSDVLSKEMVERMLQKKGVDFIEFAHAAHAPALMDPEQMEAVVHWLGTAPK